MRKCFLSLLVLLIFTGGCATDPDKMRASDVSPLQYSDYDCEQLTYERSRVNRKIGESPLVS